MTGLPLASFRASGSEALTTRQEVMGMREASSLGSSKTKLCKLLVSKEVGKKESNYLDELWL